MSPIWLIFFVVPLVLSHEGSHSHELSSAQIRTAADSIKSFLVRSLNNANETDAEGHVETPAETLTTLRASFIDLYDTIKTNTIIAVDRKIPRDNICGRAELRNLPATEGYKFRGSASCQQFKHGIRCLEQVLTPDSSNETMRIKRCCGGTETEDILKFGCKPVKEAATSIEVILQKYKCTGKRYFANESTTYIIVENSSEEIIELPGVQHVYDWFHGGRVIDKKGASYVISQDSNSVERVVTYLNGVQITTADITVKEGIVHVVNKKIASAGISIGEILQTKYSEFYKILSSQIRNKLKANNGKSYTIFVVSNSDINKKDAGFFSRVSSKKQEIAETHIFIKSTCSYAFSSTTLISISGKQVYILKSATGEFKIGGAIIKSTDIVNENGVLGKQFLPALDKLWNEKLMSENPTFVQAVCDKYPPEKAMTVFIPPKSYAVQTADISNHVLLHQCEEFSFEKTVVSDSKSKYFFGKFPQHEPLWNASAYGEEPFNDLKWFQLGCTRIAPAGVQIFNTNVYFIEKPLPTIKHSLSSWLKTQKDLSRFEKIFKHFMTFSTTPVGFTIFIPTDKAFNNIPSKFRNDYLAVLFMHDHMLFDPICPHDLKAGQEGEFRTYSQKKVHMKNKSGEILVYGAPIVKRVELSDCVVFTIDQILTHPN